MDVEQTGAGAQTGERANGSGKQPAKKLRSRRKGWRKYTVLRRFTAALLGGEPRQYSAFLSIWHFIRATQQILRTASVCLAFLLYIGDMQELAPANFSLLLQWAFYGSLSYSLCSALLFLLAPGGHAMQGLQEYRAMKLYLRFKHSRANKEGMPNALSRPAWQSWQKLLNRWRTYREQQQWSWDRIHNYLHLQFRLWLRLPLGSLGYLLELVLGAGWAAILYVLLLVQGFSVLS